MPAMQRIPGALPQKKSLALQPLPMAGDLCVPPPQRDLHPLEIHDPMSKSRSRADGAGDGARKKHKRDRRSISEMDPGGPPGSLAPLPGMGNRFAMAANSTALAPVPPEGPRPHRLRGVGRKTTHVAALDVVDGIGGQMSPGLELRHHLKVTPRQRDMGRQHDSDPFRRAFTKAPPDGLWRPGMGKPEAAPAAQLSLGKFKALPSIAAHGHRAAVEEQPAPSSGTVVDTAEGQMWQGEDLLHTDSAQDEPVFIHHDGADECPGACSGCHAMVTEGEQGEPVVAIFWLDPDEGGEPMRYEIHVKKKSSWTPVDMTQVEFTGPGSAELSGLSPEILSGNVSCRVRACNTAGPGPWSEPSE